MERQYALVLNGVILTDRNGDLVTSGYMASAPEDYSSFYPEGAVWLPITDEDTQPFEKHRHWRGAPAYEVRGDQVFRVWPVKAIGQS